MYLFIFFYFFFHLNFFFLPFFFFYPCYIVLEGPEVHGRFGSGLAVVDLNKDGVADLAVSAPSVGTAALTYYGKVYVYFGRANSTLSTTPGMIITGATTYTNLGSTLAGGDLDNDGFADLVVGSPFATTNQGQDQGGIVSIFTSSSIAKQLAIATTTTTLELSINDAAYTLYGEMQYSWFGYFISVHTIATGSTVLLVGAPTLRVCHNSDCSFSSSDIQSVGKLYAFSPFTSSGSTPLFTLRGSQALSKLGKSATIGFPFGPNGGAHVVVSTPNEDVSGKIEAIPDTLLQAGTVYVLKLSDLLGKNLDINSTNVITSFSGDRRYARFGWSVALTDVNGDGNDDLLVSAPTRTDDFTGEIYGGEEGGIYVYYGGAKFPTGDATKHCGLLGINQPCTSKVASFTVHPSESFSRFGASFIAVDLTGSGQRNVVGGSERSNKGSYLGGTVTVHTQ